MATGMLVHDMIYLPFATKWYNSTLVLSSWFYPNENLWKMFKDPKRSFSGPLKLFMSLSKIYEKSLKIFFRTFEALEDHVTDLRKSLKIFFRTFEALDNLVKDLWKSLKIFFRTFEALEDLVTDLWKILKGLLQDLWSSWGSCQRSMNNPWRSSSRIIHRSRDLWIRSSRPWKLLKILSKIYEKS